MPLRISGWTVLIYNHANHEISIPEAPNGANLQANEDGGCMLKIIMSLHLSKWTILGIEIACLQACSVRSYMLVTRLICCPPAGSQPVLWTAQMRMGCLLDVTGMKPLTGQICRQMMIVISKFVHLLTFLKC